jgi:hypothetical protein
MVGKFIDQKLVEIEICLFVELHSLSTIKMKMKIQNSKVYLQAWEAGLGVVGGGF